MGALPAGSYQVRVSDPLGRLDGIRWLHDDGTGSGELTLVATRSASTAFAVAGGQVLDVGTFFGRCGCWIG